MSGWWLTRLSNTLVFHDPQPPIISILYKWTGTCSQSGLQLLMFSSKLIILELYYYILLLHLISSFLSITFLLVPHAYVSIEFIDCICLPVQPCQPCHCAFHFYIFDKTLILIYCFFKNTLWFSQRIATSIWFFLSSLFHFEVELLLWNFCNLQI